jgi:RNA polymerase sigma factor (sigma-70 family)
MITAERLLPASPSDADLVRSSLNGTSAAFAEIVARYQALISSLTYSATGSLARSEDLAQEVFVAAWKDLGQLREPEKLRPWLCGIARRLAASARRHEGREPACAARELEDDLHSAAAGPAEQAISREEESILWRSLEQIPETYREPLILFYREEQSVDRVAAALDLSADTAKQRLSRGRKMLKEQVALFVEGALRQSTPGRAFTMAVITSLPLMTASASGATIGAAAVKSGSAATALGSTAAGVLLGPLIGCLGAWIGVKASLASAESEREKELIRTQTRRLIALVLGFTVLIVLAITFQQRLWANATTAAIVLCALLPITYAVVLTALILRFRRAHARVIAEETPKRTPQTAASQAQGNTPFEYRSKATLLGLPLIHVRVGVGRGEKMRPALGWVELATFPSAC